MNLSTKAVFLLAAATVFSSGLTGCNRSSSEAAASPKPEQAAQSSAPAQTVAPASTASASTNAVAAAASIAPSAAQPQVILDEDFQENAKPDNYYDNMEMNGVKAGPVNLTGASWQLATGDGTYESYLTPKNNTGAACFHNTASVALKLASNGAYVKPTVMTISAHLGFGADTETGKCLLGFYSALAGPHSYDALANFTGLVLQTDGTLQLVEKGKPVGTGVKFTGKFDLQQGAVLLSYSVDTTKGTISNITLAGSSSDYTLTSTAFTDAATAFVGIGGTDSPSFCYLGSLKILSGIVLLPPPPAPTPDSAPSNGT